MFRFYARKPGRNNEDLSLVLVHKALDNCERSFDENPRKAKITSTKRKHYTIIGAGKLEEKIMKPAENR